MSLHTSPKRTIFPQTQHKHHSSSLNTVASSPNTLNIDALSPPQLLTDVRYPIILVQQVVCVNKSSQQHITLYILVTTCGTMYNVKRRQLYKFNEMNTFFETNETDNQENNTVCL